MPGAGELSATLMRRRRLAVVLLVPSPLATEIDGIRRACGDPRLGRIASHITLVPPINVGEDAVSDAVDLCRKAAAATPALHLTLGAPSTFAPTTPLAWLSVGGDINSATDLRARLDTGPLARPADHPFVAHLTISGIVATDRLHSMIRALSDFAAECVIDRLHVLENRQLMDGRWGWLPLAEATFGRSRAIGVGGLALELSVGAMMDPDAAALFAIGDDDANGTLTVTARQDGAVVGLAVGAVQDGLAVLERLVVAEGLRRQGIGSHLLARFTAEAAGRGCDAAVRAGATSDPVSTLCRQRGWTDAAAPAPGMTTLVRLLAERSPERSPER